MAKKTIFQDIDYNNAIDIGLTDYTAYDVYTGSSTETVLHIESTIQFRSTIDKLEAVTQKNLNGLKRGFILPSCTVGAERLKEALREHKIVVTNDYEKADFIITHESLHNDECSDIFKSTKMFNSLQNLYMSSDVQLGMLGSNPLLWTRKISENHTMHLYDVESAPYDLNIISGLAINLCKLIDDGEMAVIDVNTVLCSSSNIQKLTEETSADLLRMLYASSEDTDLAISIIPTLDPASEPAVLWQFCTEANSQLSWGHSRNKDLQYWKESVEFYKLSRLTPEEAVNHFIEEGTLTNKSFKILEPLCRKDIELYNREMYTFVVQLKPEYAKYLNTKNK